MKKYNICYNCGKRKPTIKFPDYGFHIGLTCKVCWDKLILHDHSYVYVLIDPRNKEVFYVGQSNNPEKRYRTHLYDKNPASTRKYNRIQDIRVEGYKPELLIVDVAEKTKIYELENLWLITGWKKKWPLTCVVWLYDFVSYQDVERVKMFYNR